MSSPVSNMKFLQPLDEQEELIQITNQVKKRAVCATCHRPKASTCICSALPKEKIQLHYTYCVILQHPNEAKQHQNRTLPFIEHCIDEEHYLKIIGRRLPSLTKDSVIVPIPLCSAHNDVISNNNNTEITDTATTNSISDDNDEIRSQYVLRMNGILDQNGNFITAQSPTTIWLLSPNDTTAISLTEALYEWEEQKRATLNYTNYPKIIVFVIDATWKYAKEMDRSNVQHDCYPSSIMQRIQLTPSDFDHPIFAQQQQQQQQHGNFTSNDTAVALHRFSIRTPPKSDAKSNMIYLSTAECLAYVLARIERNDSIYYTIMKPLDLMVQQWHANYTCGSKKE
jgi:DTW domain-containing protein YfiP